MAASNRPPQPKVPQPKPSFSESDQYIRKIQLTLSGGGSGLDLSNMRITFRVKKNTLQSPNLIEARVYNLKPETEVQAIEQKQVTLQAGYKYGRFGKIFDGTVVQYRKGKETPVDTYLEIIGGDGDLGVNYNGTTHKQWDAGTTREQIVKDNINAIPGVTVGSLETGDWGKQKIVRSQTAAGMSTEYLRQLANSANAEFFIDGGKAFFIQRNQYRQGDTVVLSPATGLIGMPEVTPEGIQIRCLLNPTLIIGGLVKLDTKFLSGVPFQPGSIGPLTEEQAPSGLVFSEKLGRTPLSSAFTSPTGTYKILLLEDHGDTRGNPWYSDMTCVALGTSNNAIPSQSLPYDRATL